MADYDRRPRGGRGGYGSKKRRYNNYRDDESDERQPQRRRYDEPPQPPIRKLRKQLLEIAESPFRKPEEDVASISKLFLDAFADEEAQEGFCDLILQLVVEQPFKIPFAAAIILVVNPQKPEVTPALLAKAAAKAQEYVADGLWREFKLVLRFLACLQGLLEDDGVFPLLDTLFERAVDLQTASSEDALGLEIVKIILMTLPYAMSSSAQGQEQLASCLLQKTDIIASTPHSLEDVVDPYPGNGQASTPAREPTSLLRLLQEQLQSESERSWELICIPRSWEIPAGEGGQDALANATKHPLPAIRIPSPVHPGSRTLFPEIYFSVYADQDIQTVPPSTDVGFSLFRDSLVDTINILDYNRNIAAKFLIDLDCYFSPETFVKRATPFDRLKDVPEGKSTWKPEDVAVDAVFSQLFQLPMAEHKLVYYHSVLTEACKIAPAAIAPSLGRAIRYLYRNIDSMDLELSYRFMDWFSHHLSNFGFTWKWTEWVEDVELPNVHPKKSFMTGALEKEIRLSFASRIRGTLPAPYQSLISEAKEKDTPEFKYKSEDTPFSAQGMEIMTLLRKKAPEDEIQHLMDQIDEQAPALNITDPLVASTDVYVTSICFIGSKSLSHVLSCIERCKERLLAIGPASEPARRQIIASVMDYWRDQPGIGANIIDKLLNYTILTPLSVIEWVLLSPHDTTTVKGAFLAESHMYEMVSTTVFKVTNRVRQIVQARFQARLAAEQAALLDSTMLRERTDMQALFSVIEGALQGFASLENGSGTDEETLLIRGWGERWLRVFRRKFAVEEAVLAELSVAAKEQDVDGDVQVVDRDVVEEVDVKADVKAEADAVGPDGTGDVLVDASTPVLGNGIE
ncbi:MAG: hypothetical protein M1829_000511 [Trizodia sp. TS-e1964]|nr:MAG: hypothetical protein M1829_000511 [Trizodia sp. TS-e1964]